MDLHEFQLKHSFSTVFHTIYKVMMVTATRNIINLWFFSPNQDDTDK